MKENKAKRLYVVNGRQTGHPKWQAGKEPFEEKVGREGGEGQRTRKLTSATGAELEWVHLKLQGSERIAIGLSLQPLTDRNGTGLECRPDSGLTRATWERTYQIQGTGNSWKRHSGNAQTFARISV
eukprot:1161266-Pelagomonas_calceolata.AAC.16